MEGMGLVLSLALLAAAQKRQAAPVTLKLGDPAPPPTVPRARRTPTSRTARCASSSSGPPGAAFKLGDKDGAVRWQTKAVEMIGDEAAMARRREMAVKVLEEYKGGR